MNLKKDDYEINLIFDDKDHIYFSIGDRGNRNVNPQNIKRDGGKIYRLHDDGSIPEDNPFASSINAKQAIFSYGHRNPQGMAINPILIKYGYMNMDQRVEMKLIF